MRLRTEASGRQRTGREAVMLLLLSFLLLFAVASSAEKVPSPYERVIIFGVDGAGAMIREGHTPNFDRIFADGCITYEARASYPTMSSQGWGAIFYGVPGEVHGSSNDFTMRSYKNNELYPSIFKLTRQAYPQAKTASFANWVAINWGIIERDYGVFMYPNNREEPPREKVVRHVLKYLDQNKPTLMFVYFVDVDHALHEYGYRSEEYFRAMEETDEQIGIIYDTLEQKGLLENTLVIFATDHGGNDQKGHGGKSEDEIKVTFAISGPGVEEHGSIEDMELQDVAAIVLYALGIEQPEIQTGRVPKGIFPGVGGGERKQSDLPEVINRYGSGVTATAVSERRLPDSLSEKLVYYQTFDGEIKGLAGEGRLSDGLLGNALDMREGFLKTGVKNSTKWKGMTIGFWFRDEGEDGDPVFVTDKNWMNGKNKGFVIAKKGHRIQVNIGCGTKFRKDIFCNLPEEYQGKWVHCLVVFDQDEKEVRMYYDFKCVAKVEMLPPKRISWATGKEMIAGQDTTGKYEYRMNGNLDELMIFNQALTPQEVEEMKGYYDPLFTERPNE